MKAALTEESVRKGTIKLLDEMVNLDWDERKKIQ